jgi:ABC-type sugar transport system permease subunit
VYRQAFQAYDLGYASTVITGLLAFLTVVYVLYLRNAGRALRSANV